MRIVLFGVEEKHFGSLDAILQPVDVAVDHVAAQSAVDRAQQRRFAAAVFAREQNQGMGKIHHDRHVEVQTDQNRVRQNLENHGGPPWFGIAGWAVNRSSE